jgi:hypothetical protein
MLDIRVVNLPISAEAHPASLRICGASEDFAIEAAADDGAGKAKKWSMTGYTGGMMRLEGWFYPVVVDLEGLSVPRQVIPTLYAHDRERIVGQTSEITKSTQRLRLAGTLREDVQSQTPGAMAAAEIIALSKSKFEWQGSIGASPDEVRFVPAGESFKANGRNFDGPAYHVVKSTLAEISFVPIGADMNTSANVAAQAHQGETMNPEFVAWLKAQDYTEAEINALAGTKRLPLLQAAWEASKKPTQTVVAPVQATQNPTPAGGTFSDQMAAIELESARVSYIRERTVNAARQYVGDQERIKQLTLLCEGAVNDQKVTKNDFDLALLRFDRAIAPTVIVGGSSQAHTEDVLEAAICITCKLPGVEKVYSDQVLQAAHSRFRRGIGLKELFQIAAERNNSYRGSTRDERALCRAAFKIGHDDIRASGAGPSTIAVPGILSNVANKFLAAGFLFTEQSHRQISRIRPANDFKQMTTYRLTGANKFKKVSPGGEIKHGSLSELTYTNQVETYGIMLGIDRRDIRNDDLGAFTGVAQELGRGGGDSLNEVFWAEFVDDSTFFPTDKSLGNYDDGATDSVLSLAGLNNAETILRLQTKPDGTPLGALPAIILTPATLYNTALQLMGSQGLVVGTTPASGPQTNVFFGRYRVVSSVFLDAVATIGTTAWYLLCDPNNIPVIEMAFLDGIESPTVETSEFDFDQLGMAMRGYMDFGCNKQEYRGGVKLKGAA